MDSTTDFYDCRSRKKLHCPGRIEKKADNTYTFITLHNHAGQVQATQVAASKFTEKINEDAKRLDIETASLVSDNYDKLPNAVKAILPHKRSLVKKANRKQAKEKAKIPKEARKLENFGMHRFIRLFACLFFLLTCTQCFLKVALSNCMNARVAFFKHCVKYSLTACSSFHFPTMFENYSKSRI